MDFFVQIFVKSSNIKFHQNPSSGSRVFLCGRTDWRTDGHDEADSRLSKFFANEFKISLKRDIRCLFCFTITEKELLQHDKWYLEWIVNVCPEKSSFEQFSWKVSKLTLLYAEFVLRQCDWKSSGCLLNRNVQCTYRQMEKLNIMNTLSKVWKKHFQKKFKNLVTETTCSVNVFGVLRC